MFTKNAVHYISDTFSKTIFLSDQCMYFASQSGVLILCKVNIGAAEYKISLSKKRFHGIKKQGHKCPGFFCLMLLDALFDKDELH